MRDLIIPAVLAVLGPLTGFVFGSRQRNAETVKITSDGEGGFVSNIQQFVTELMASNRTMLADLGKVRDDLAATRADLAATQAQLGAETSAREAAERRVDELVARVESQRNLIARLEAATEQVDRRKHGSDPRLGGNRSTDIDPDGV